MIAGAQFEELYQEHWPFVFALCASRLGDREAALDAAQTVFVRKWVARETYDPERASFRVWVQRNAVNLCIDLLRERGRRPTTSTLADDVTSPLPTAEAALQERARVARALAVLPKGQRQLVLMRALEGYTWQEIACLTGQTVSQVRTAVGRGLERLRAALAAQGVEVEL